MYWAPSNVFFVPRDLQLSARFFLPRIVLRLKLVQLCEIGSKVRRPWTDTRLRALRSWGWTGRTVSLLCLIRVGRHHLDVGEKEAKTGYDGECDVDG